MKRRTMVYIMLMCIFSSAFIQAQTTVVYNYTGSLQTFIVPPCVSSINVDMTGGKGGDNASYTGGSGGRVQAILPVTPGDTLHIYVGEAGQNAMVAAPAGFNGGGAVFSYSSSGTAGTGGGASDIRRAPYTSTDRLIIAGGGGGGGYQSIGGHGGGLVGQDGVPFPSWPNSGGKGGTQISGGGAGIACCSCPTYTTAGTFSQGGDGSGDGAGGGGGGGGFYGGGGSCFAGGGGGSSYTDPAATSVIHTQGYNAGAGQISITYTQGTPSGPITGSLILCEGDTATYSISPVPGASSYFWTLPSGWMGTSNTASIFTTSSNVSGNIEVYSNLCTNTSSISSVTVNNLPLVTAVTTDSVICDGDTITLTGTGASTYLWSNGVIDGDPFAPFGTTVYSVVGTDANNCKGSATVSVTVNLLPNITYTAVPANTICINDSVTLTATGASTYLWTGGINNGIAFSPISSGNYTVTGTDSVGCINTATASVVVNTLPVVNLGANIVQPSAPAILDAGTGFSSYLWSTNESTQTISVSMNGTYIVNVTNSSGCSNSDTVQVFFTSGIYNNDGTSTTIQIYPNPSNGIFHLKIDNLETQDLSIDITDMSGKSIYKQLVGSVSGSSIQVLDVNHITSGSYILRIIANGEITQRIFIINK